MQQRTPSALVIWYDAVTVEGRLQWQDSLTELNTPFFDACDGIFVNYTWRVRTPARHASTKHVGGARTWVPCPHLHLADAHAGNGLPVQSIWVGSKGSNELGIMLHRIACLQAMPICS